MYGSDMISMQLKYDKVIFHGSNKYISEMFYFWQTADSVLNQKVKAIPTYLECNQ